MTKKLDLVGKTISGVVARPVTDDGPLKIWMLQFSDGTHVEFVSPAARRALRQLSNQPRRPLAEREAAGQMVLNVA